MREAWMYICHVEFHLEQYIYSQGQLLRVLIAQCECFKCREANHWKTMKNESYILSKGQPESIREITFFKKMPTN